MQESQRGWIHLTEQLRTVIAGASKFVIQLEVAGYDQSPYLQGYYESNGAATIEFSSDAFIRPSYSSQQDASIRRLGWTLSKRADLPNYIKFLERDESTDQSIAEIFILTLSEGLGLHPTDVRVAWTQPSNLNRSA